MQQLEILKSRIPEVKVSYDHLMPKKLSGLFHNNSIILNGKNDYHKNVSVLAEEIGHYHTSHGDITDYSKINNMKQEHKARRYAVKLVLPLEKLIECYKRNVWGNVFEVCNYLEITTDFFEYAVEDYKRQFGTYVKYDGYLINFESLHIERVME